MTTTNQNCSRGSSSRRTSAHYTRREKVSFNAAYGNERMVAYLFLPRTGKPPFQTVIYFPGSSAWSLRSIAAYGSAETFESHTRHGRAFVFPVLQGTFERMTSPEQQGRTTLNGNPNHVGKGFPEDH